MDNRKMLLAAVLGALGWFLLTADDANAGTVDRVAPVRFTQAP